MLRNYLLMTWRNLLRHRVFSLVNILGLAIGIAAGLLILQFTSYELGYDRHFPDGERIYRIWMEKYWQGELQTSEASTFPAVADALKTAFPEVESTVRSMYSRGSQWTAGEPGGETVFLKEVDACIAEPDFLDLFGIQLQTGNRATALLRPYTVLISEEMAETYFPNENPLGKTLREDGEEAFEITGVFRTLSGQSHIQFDLIKSYSTLASHFTRLTGRETDVPTASWDWPRTRTYVKLRDHADIQSVSERLRNLIASYKPSSQSKGIEELLYLQPVGDIHLHSPRGAPFASSTEAWFQVWFSWLIAGIVLLLAWINYVNLSTARATDRAKEVGIRKTLGANRSGLIRQFMFEAICLNLLAGVIGVIMFEVVRIPFNGFMEMLPSYSLLASPVNWMWLGGGLISCALVSGFYPAIVLSGFNPTQVLKGARKHGDRRGFSLRKVLAVGQFAATIILLVGTLGVFRQIDYMKTRDLGLNIDRVLVIKGPRSFDYEAFSEQPDLLKGELNKLSGVRSATSSYSVPGQRMSAYQIHRVDLPAYEGRFYSHEVGHDFPEVYGMAFLAGRNFSRSFASDDSAVIVNETALRMLGFQKPEEALGHRITTPEDGYLRTIIGVVKDFHHLSLHHAFWPVTISLDQESRGYYSLKLQTTDLPGVIAQVREVYERVFPGNVFDYFFLDSAFNEQYLADRRFGQIFGLFAGLSILIACLGLFGLAALMATQRTREIGIRKVLGASVNDILKLLTGNYLRLLVIAVVLGVPVAMIALNTWLEGFAFQMPFSIWLFVIPAFVVIGIAMITVLVQTFQTAKANPVDALRDE